MQLLSCLPRHPELVEGSAQPAFSSFPNSIWERACRGNSIADLLGLEGRAPARHGRPGGRPSTEKSATFSLSRRGQRDYFLGAMKPPDLNHLNAHMVVRIARVSQALDALASLESCLDPRDRARAARFRFPEDRARFILGRGLVRTSLAHAFQQPPDAIDLAYTDRDRPYFPHDEAIQFSISHTHDLVALALTRGARIGIDLEHIRPNADLPELAKRILSAEDLRTFLALPPTEKPAAFFRVWTRKEAYLKARGEGITEGLREFSVSLGPEEISGVEDRREKSPAPPWRFHLLPVPDDYASSLACDDPHRPLDFSFAELHADAHFQKIAP